MNEKANVYECIAKCAQEIATTGISKDRSNQQQGYKFRGIDDVYNALAPIISKNGLVILPRVMSRSVVERTTQKGGLLFYTTVECEFDFVSMYDQSKHVVKTYGEAMDSGDKSTNKAMSAAYKYACMQAFCIPTEGDNDADAQTHVVVQQEEKFSPENKSIQAEVITKIALCKDGVEIQSLIDEYLERVEHLPEELSGDINAQLDNRRKQIKDGINPQVTGHKFAGVDDAIKWMTKMAPVVKGFKSIKVLDEWENYNRPWLNGLECLKAEKYKKDGKSPRERMLQALMDKRCELENINTANTPVG